tara:strand:+ start:8818 stop:9822 length:1005 start_codon:yes stop_codon:yes gene_type:complete
MFQKLFYFGSLFTIYVNSQFLPGSQVDISGHGCVIDGGYQWCEELNSCVRSWETACPSLMLPSIPPISIDPLIEPVNECFEPCPPPAPCPMPELFGIDMSQCKLNNVFDDCGCQVSCPLYDCSNINCNSDSDCHVEQFCRPMQTRLPMVNGRRLQRTLSECVDKVGINETCGGYTLPEFQTRCLDHLECVNTMGPMIADAPGQCKEPCLSDENRNQYGECVSLTPIRIPDNCATWYDGCNTCQVRDGRAEICTMMYCFRQDTPYCMSYHINTNSLEVDDVCYRFCEDGTQETINRRSDCPQGTVCKSVFNENSVSMISYDSCNDRALTCLPTGH